MSILRVTHNVKSTEHDLLFYWPGATACLYCRDYAECGAGRGCFRIAGRCIWQRKWCRRRLWFRLRLRCRLWFRLRSGAGCGSGYGSVAGCGSGYGSGAGCGSGYGSGAGCGFGAGCGSGYGCGSGSGIGSGCGSGSGLDSYLTNLFCDNDVYYCTCTCGCGNFEASPQPLTGGSDGHIGGSGRGVCWDSIKTSRLIPSSELAGCFRLICRMSPTLRRRSQSERSARRWTTAPQAIRRIRTCFFPRKSTPPVWPQASISGKCRSPNIFGGVGPKTGRRSLAISRSKTETLRRTATAGPCTIFRSCTSSPQQRDKTTESCTATAAAICHSFSIKPSMATSDS